MKFFISFLFSCNLHLQAQTMRPVLVTYNDHYDEALIVKEIIHRKTGTPLSLISIEMQYLPCERSTQQPLWHLCVDNRKELHEIYVDLNFIKRGIKIFSQEI